MSWRLVAAAGVRAHVGRALCVALQSQLVKRDAPVLSQMRELAAQYPRYGYRRINEKGIGFIYQKINLTPFPAHRDNVTVNVTMPYTGGTDIGNNN